MQDDQSALFERQLMSAPPHDDTPEKERGINEAPGGGPDTSDPGYRRRARIAWVVVGVMLVGLFALDFGNTQHYKVIDSRMQKVQREALGPMGAVERTDSDYWPVIAGADTGQIQDRCFINGIVPVGGRCPEMEKAWLVPATSGDDTRLAQQILKTAGVEPSRDEGKCPAGITACGLQDGVRIKIASSDIGAVKPPNQDISPKQWRLIKITIDYIWFW